jgi:hypothetical protein
MGNRPGVILSVLGLAIFLAFIQVHHIILFYSTDDLNANIDVAFGITTGHPHWRVYQSRILGPYLLKGLAGISGSYVSAYTIMMIGFLSFAGYQAWQIGKRLGRDQTGWFALIVLHLTFAFFLSENWLYPWDLIGLNIFLAFVGFIISGRPWYWLCALFAIAIFNRDSGQLIALWLILEPACRWLIRSPLSMRVSAAMVTAGVLCIAMGTWIIEYLRTSMLVEEIGFKIVGTPSGYGPNYFWNLPGNLTFVQHLWHAESLVDFIYTIFPLVLFIGAIVFVALVVYREKRYLALAMTFAVLLVSISLFGFIPETRVFIEIIPLVILGSCLLVHPRNFAQGQNSKDYV